MPARTFGLSRMFAGTALVALTLGCAETKSPPPAYGCNGCLQVERAPYPVTVEFTNYEGKSIRVPVRSTYSKSPDPSFAVLYQTKATGPDGRESWFYSWEEPVKRCTGMLELTTVAGALVSVQAPWLEIRLIPARQLSVDSVSQVRQAQWAEYEQLHVTCREHKYKPLKER